ETSHFISSFPPNNILIFYSNKQQRLCIIWVVHLYYCHITVPSRNLFNHYCKPSISPTSSTHSSFLFRLPDAVFADHFLSVSLLQFIFHLTKYHLIFITN